MAYVSGIDEVGRGALAGPVLAGAVTLGPALADYVFRDSKQCSEKKRTIDAQHIKQHAEAWSIGLATVVEIEALGILEATLLAMRRAALALNRTPEHLWIDGTHAPDLPIPTTTVIKGDQSVQAIAAASILAKVMRDQWLCHYEKRFPGYGFAQHKGYGTQAHRDAIERLGPCAVHRRTFAPINRWS